MLADKATQYGVARIGRLYGLGVGPGDPELLTLKARRVLTEVPVIFVPKKSEDDKSISESIITGLVPNAKSKITQIILPMLRDKQKLQEYWQQAADIIWYHLNQGKDGAFVNVGDPLLYGTFTHVMKMLQRNHPEIEIEVIPGISSINAAAARTVIPLASDDDNIAIISGDHGDKAIRETLENFDTVVFIKMNKVFDKLLKILGELNMIDKCVYVRRCTTQDEEIIRDIDRLKDEMVDYFSLLIVRK